MATKSGFDTDTILKNMKPGMTMAQVMKATAEEQARKDVLAEKYGKLAVIVTLALVPVTFASFLASYPLAALSILGALFTVITWQQTGILIGVAIIALVVNRAIQRLDKKISPYALKFLEIKKAEKAARKAAAADSEV